MADVIHLVLDHACLTVKVLVVLVVPVVAIEIVLVAAVC